MIISFQVAVLPRPKFSAEPGRMPGLSTISQ
jgi:hypothetical protein